MKLGVHGFNSAPAGATAKLARLAEELGYESWWTADHIVMPTGPGARYDARMPFVEPLVHLAHVAAVTSRLTLGTAIVVLPQRNPLLLAKQAASVDALSGGRLVLGVGAGWLEEELTVLGVPMAERGARSDEYLDAMAALWHDHEPQFHGRFVDFADVDAYPRPVGLRVVVAGHSAAVYRRAVSRADGFYGNGSFADTVAEVEGLRRAAGEVGRPAGLGELEITAMPPEPPDKAAVAAYAELGVDRLVVRPKAFDDVDELARYLERSADLLV